MPNRSTRRAALLAGVALSLVTPAYAQGTSDIAALERQLEALKQEIEALKAQQRGQQELIEQREDARVRDIEALKAQQRAQQQQIEQQAAAQAPVFKGAPPLVDQFVKVGDKPKSFKIPGTDTSIRIGGYVKGDLIYNVDEDLGDSFAVSAITPAGIPTKDGTFRAHARQSRFNIATWTPTSIGEFETFIEADFFGTGGNEIFSNSTSARIRHAFGKLNQEDWNVLVGQTWTNFMPLESYPETVDFFGPAGIPFVRQGQARFTYTGFEGVNISVSAENSELTGRDEQNQNVVSEGSGLQFGIDKIPDFTAAIDYTNPDGWYFRLAGVARLLATDTAGPPPFVLPTDDEEFGWGVTASALIPMAALGPTFEEDSIQLNFSYGDGIGRYIVNGFGEDAFLNVQTGQLEPITSWGFAGGYTHYWSPQWRSNFVYGHYEVEDLFFADDTKRLQSVHVNLIWSPFDWVNIGIEYMYGMRSFADSSLDNDAQRIQGALQILF